MSATIILFVDDDGYRTLDEQCHDAEERRDRHLSGCTACVEDRDCATAHRLTDELAALVRRFDVAYPESGGA